MIPKTLHFCWFSTDKYPPQIQRCIRSWHKYLPDYEIVLWDTKRFPFDSVPFVQRCIELKKWAFAADYIRLYAVYTYGGIYLDSDVEVLQSLDPVLKHGAFWGIDANSEQNYFFPEAAIFGAEKGFAPLKEMMQFYETLPLDEVTPAAFNRLTNVCTAENRSILQADGRPHLVTAPVVAESVLAQYGFRQVNEEQTLAEGIHIYSQPTFLNSTLPNTPTTLAHHHNASSWLFTQRGKFFLFCHHHPVFMPFYKTVEKIRTQFSHNS